MIKIKQTKLEGCYEIIYKSYSDTRGDFQELYNSHKYFRISKIPFVQVNLSRSKKNVLRGLHFQSNFPQAKLISVTKGKIFDVAVDLRISSRTFGMWHGAVLSDFNKKQLYVPEKFAHGFLVLSNHAEVVYKCSNYYNKNDETTLFWKDKNLNINWPIKSFRKIITSQKDSNGIDLEKLISLKKL